MSQDSDGDVGGETKQNLQEPNTPQSLNFMKGESEQNKWSESVTSVLFLPTLHKKKKKCS